MSSPAPSTPKTKNVFSPVAVASSPVSRIPQKGNLTGLPRNVRDLIAEFHSQIQAWDVCHLEGSIIITKMTALNLFDGAQRNEAADGEMQQLCDSLELIVQQMAPIVLIMARIKRELEVMTMLGEVKENNYNSAENPLFLTWPLPKFAEIVGFITSCYQSELETRKFVAEKMGLSSDIDDFYFYEAAWTQEPMLFPDVISFKLEAALVETGLRY